MSGFDYDAAIEAEDRMRDAVIQMIESNLSAIRYAWHWGDGEGGWIFSEMEKRVLTNEPRRVVREPHRQKKAKIHADLRRQVFERYAYRCVTCGGHHDLCIDHIVPESKGGETVFENLQAMCRSCNSKKGARI